MAKIFTSSTTALQQDQAYQQLSANQKRAAAQAAQWTRLEYREQLLPQLATAAREHWDKVSQNLKALDQEK